MVIIVCECFWWLRITLILFLAFNSQGPKALAEVQRGWHQKLRQLVKQPLSKGFLFAFQSIPNVPLFKLSKDTTLRYVLSVYIKILISWKIKRKRLSDSLAVLTFPLKTHILSKTPCAIVHKRVTVEELIVPGATLQQQDLSGRLSWVYSILGIPD